MSQKLQFEELVSKYLNDYRTVILNKIQKQQLQNRAVVSSDHKFLEVVIQGK